MTPSVSFLISTRGTTTGGTEWGEERDEREEVECVCVCVGGGGGGRAENENENVLLPVYCKQYINYVFYITQGP